MSKGWISLHRQFQDHWLWGEPRKYSKAEAWLDILMTANHADGKFVYRGKLFICHRGELLRSLDKLRKKWDWSKSAAVRFLKLLEQDGMITLKSETVLTRITVCRYNDYQDLRNDVDTQPKRARNAGDTKQGTYNNKNKKEQGEQDIIPIVSDETKTTLDDLWNNTPAKGRNRSSKKKVLDAWKKIKSKPDRETLIHAIQEWSRSEDWTKDGGEFVQGLHIWIKDERWETLPESSKQPQQQTMPNIAKLC
jgi:hypothetical protein